MLTDCSGNITDQLQCWSWTNIIVMMLWHQIVPAHAHFCFYAQIQFQPWIYSLIHLAPEWCWTALHHHHHHHHQHTKWKNCIYPSSRVHRLDIGESLPSWWKMLFCQNVLACFAFSWNLSLVCMYSGGCLWLCVNKEMRAKRKPCELFNKLSSAGALFCSYSSKCPILQTNRTAYQRKCSVGV